VDEDWSELVRGAVCDHRVQCSLWPSVLSVVHKKDRFTTESTEIHREKHGETETIIKRPSRGNLVMVGLMLFNRMQRYFRLG